jgi:putative salt-induced outer membrane protein YdiY
MKSRIVWLCVGAASILLADEVRLQDGSVLKGKIGSISNETIAMDTGYAGALKLDRAQVVSFSTDEAVYVRLHSGMVVPGVVQGSPTDELVIKGADAQVSTVMASVKEGWVRPEADPEILARDQAVAEMQRKWSFQVAANVNVKSGNTEEKALGLDAQAQLKSKDDELKFYVSVVNKESDGEKTSDERKAGMRYTSYFNDPWGWYVRQELENDSIENIQLRTVSAVGLSRRFINQKQNMLSANAGFSYRSETYKDNTDSAQNAGLDLGVQHFYRFKNRFEIHNELTYIPSIEDFASYLITQKSYLDLPLGDSKVWKVRVGLSNDYTSTPEGGRKGLDTTYYSSLVADWK